MQYESILPGPLLNLFQLPRANKLRLHLGKCFSEPLRQNVSPSLFNFSQF